MREIPDELVQRYRREGWWTPDTLGDLVHRGLARAPEQEFRVHSKVRPYHGSIADVEASARRLAEGLRKRGVGPGDVVAMQLPNWMEAAATFWAAALLGAVVVPIVHFYGRKELTHILGDAKPKVFISAAAFGRMEFDPRVASGVEIIGLVGGSDPALVGGSDPALVGGSDPALVGGIYPS
ncbi:AMP-binding protein, partial [Mycolicibacterium palauense]|uniref:AMP-binding protein n=1 Tax=Mycolicibacterium palauense TaxID=2034511 RepID=UPI0011459081